MRNKTLRIEIMKKGIKHYELAEALGISKFTLSHWLQNELPKEKKEMILETINKIEV